MPPSAPPDLIQNRNRRRRSSHSCSAWCCLLLISCGLFTGLARSDESAQSQKSGVLLLEGNRVIVGRVTPQVDTYSVEQPAGIRAVAKKQVLFVGSDMRSVYVHLQDSLPKKPTADDHVELARWCVGYRMLAEARFELQAALEVDPSRDDIRRNLNQLDSLLRQPISTESKKPVKSETPAQRMARLAGITANDVESLGGLSREAGQEFTRRIQPILMHNCMASACHGPKSDQKFKLSLVIQGSTPLRSATEKNLLALLTYTDREDPKSSKLWKLLKTNHGAKGSSIFVGTKGKDQLTAFQDWLRSLEETDEDQPQTISRRALAPGSSASHEKAGEKPQEAKTVQTSDQRPRYRKGEHTRPPVATKSDEEPASVPDELVSKKRTETTSKPRSAPKSKASSPPDTEPIVSATPPELSDVVAEDPFNPDEFNRLQRIKQGFGSP